VLAVAVHHLRPRHEEEPAFDNTDNSDSTQIGVPLLYTWRFCQAEMAAQSTKLEPPWHQDSRHINQLSVCARRLERMSDSEGEDGRPSRSNRGGGGRAGVVSALQALQAPPGSQCLVRVWELRARDLLALDRGGTSDPYAIVSLCGASFTTRVVRANVNPRFSLSDDFRFVSWCGG
jgi:hypothetical protein